MTDIIRTMRLELSNGPLVVSYPSAITLDDIDDFEKSMEILFRSLKRIAAAAAKNE